MAGDWKYKIVEIAQDMAGDDNKDYFELSESEQDKYYKKAYEYYLDRDPNAMGGTMRANYAYGTDDEEFGEEELDTIDIMKDQNIPYGEQVQTQESGIMQMAYEPGNYDPELVEAYEQYKYDMNEHRPGMPILEIDEFIRMYSEGTAKIDPTIRIEEVVKEFIRERGRKPSSLEELKEFYEMRIGTARGSGETDVVRELIEKDKTKITLASGGLANILGV